MSDQTNETVDIFSMGSDEFANLDLSTIGSEVSEEESTEEVDSTLDEQVEEAQEESEEYIDVEGADDELSDEEETEEQEETPEPSEEASINYEQEYKKLIGTPIKANGREITINSIEEAEKLIQLGAGYYKNMEALKPARKVIAMLEKHNLMDESQLSFAIDLLNKNPQAINKLISDLDLEEIVDEKNSQYSPKNYSVSETELNVDEALKQIEHTPTYARTVNVLGKEWDAESRKMIQQTPALIEVINSHMGNGMFDAVTAEVEKRKMLGSIPLGTPAIVAYKLVGDELYAKGNNSSVPNAQLGQQINQLKANAVVPPIRKPSETVKKDKLAAGKPKAKQSTVTEQFEDIFALDSETFKKKYLK